MDQENLDFLTQQKIELMLQLKTRKFDQELASLREQVSALESAVARLRTELAYRPVASSEPEAAPARVQEHSAQPAPPEKRESHPRQGDYKSEDVSIEKYFNFSRK